MVSGCWGSRDGIRLGVPVSYSGINHTAAPVEIALRGSWCQPDLPFGTRFFQAIAEENIKYLPLYPEDWDAVFQKALFQGKNALAALSPALSHPEELLKMIRPEEGFPGQGPLILMNADFGWAVAFPDAAQKQPAEPAPLRQDEGEADGSPEESRKWRQYLAEQPAERLDMETPGVKNVHLFGSANTSTAGWSSGIVLSVRIVKSKGQKQAPDSRLQAWSLALAKMSVLKTGCSSQGLLDVRCLTNGDIANRDACPAQPLRLREEDAPDHPWDFCGKTKQTREPVSALGFY